MRWLDTNCCGVAKLNRADTQMQMQMQMAVSDRNAKQQTLHTFSALLPELGLDTDSGRVRDW